MFNFNSKLNELFYINPLARKLALIFCDVLFLITSVFISVWLISPNNPFIFYSFFLSLTAVPIYIFTGQYRGITRFANTNLLYQVTLRNTVITIISLFIVKTFGINSLPYDRLLFTTIILVSGSQCLFRIILRNNFIFKRSQLNLIPIAIYGAGSAGSQLAESLKREGKYLIKYFIDDNEKIWSRTINDIPIKSPDFLDTVKNEIDLVLIAIPSLSEKNKKNIIKYLLKLNISILQVPSLEKLVSGQLNINEFKSLDFEYLLFREKVPAFKNLLEGSIQNKNICITGAGGSIGSELCRQIALLNPQHLIILDNSEANLYLISKEIEDKFKNKLKFSPILGNATDFDFLKDLFSSNNIDTVFHVAAYKHVPIVEANPLQGIFNNVFSTKSICEASELTDVEKVIFISTDKAVRPTNVMGASKRLAELIIQAYAYLNDKKNEKLLKRKCYSMVRFGNVLGSSGSVVPLFKKQIDRGGPITVTHKDVIRYFMSIEEATELVLQASSLASGGDVFILDMGEPVKISKLAENMILLSGSSLKNKDNPKGDIEIIYSGLRNGEKLYEELLISNKSIKTDHPLIYKANEDFIKPDSLFPKINYLYSKIKSLDKNEVLHTLHDLVPEWENKYSN